MRNQSKHKSLLLLYVITSCRKYFKNFIFSFNIGNISKFNSEIIMHSINRSRIVEKIGIFLFKKKKSNFHRSSKGSHREGKTALPIKTLFHHINVRKIWL